jgi:hypothetical protein
MPFIDLGDKPKTFDPNKSESDQMFMIPKPDYPKKLIFKYGYFDASYLPGEKTLMKRFKKS